MQGEEDRDDVMAALQARREESRRDQPGRDTAGRPAVDAAAAAGQLLGFPERGRAQPAAGFRALAEVRAYWEALAAGRMVPPRAEVNPRGIARALDTAFILERIAPSIARFRLAGSHLNDLVGMEVRGMPLTALFTPRARQRLASQLEAVFQGPSILEMGLVGEAGYGKPRLEARLLILPLTSDLGDVSRALGCCVAEGEIGRTPRRFEIVTERLTRLGPPPAAGSAGPEARRALPGQTVPGLAEPAAPWSGQPGAARREEALPQGHFLPPSPEERRAMLRIVRNED